MSATETQSIDDKNEILVKQGKKMAASDVTKRNALGDLQNRSQASAVTTDGFSKRVKPPRNQICDVKAKVDTNLKNQKKPLKVSSNQVTSQQKQPTGKNADHMLACSGIIGHRAVNLNVKNAIPKKVVEAEKKVVKNENKVSSTTEDNEKVNELVKSKPEATVVPSKPPVSFEEIKDIDEGDAGNLMLVSEYVNDIYEYLFKLETQFPIGQDYLDDQLEINGKMRAVLVDWINEVHYQFHLIPETFQMAVGLIDQYLQKDRTTKRPRLQLVGVTALLLAAKYEELFPPPIADFVYITDHTYNAAQIRQMEQKMLKALNFDMCRPIPLRFLRRFAKVAVLGDTHYSMAKYFTELALIESHLAHHKPSEIAAAALYLSLNLVGVDENTEGGLNENCWTRSLEWYSKLTVKQIEFITMDIAEAALNAPNSKLRAVYSKYQSSKFHKISTRKELYGPMMMSIVAGKNC